MRFWIREVAGWLLVLIGLGVFYICLNLLMSRNVIGAGGLIFIGFIIFRGGIHLLKVAAAAQVILYARSEADKPPARARPTAKDSWPTL